MMYLLAPARRFLRFLLACETRAVVHKHHPFLIAVIGTNNPSYVRERVYALLNEQVNARRNIERTDSELSIPLTVFGTHSYPSTYLGWIGILFKTALQLIVIRRYYHVLILHIHGTTDDIREYWLRVLSPDLIIDTDGTYSGSYRTIHLDAHDFAAFEKQADISHPIKAICDAVGVPYPQAAPLQQLSEGTPRIRLIEGKHNILLVDARYTYYPTNIRALSELVAPFDGAKLLVTDLDASVLHAVEKEFDLVVHHADSAHSGFAVIVFLVHKGAKSDTLAQLAKNDLEV